MSAIYSPSSRLWLPPSVSGRKPFSRIRQWWKKFRAPLAIASNGDILLDGSGNKVLDGSGNIILDGDSGHCPTCCNPGCCGCFAGDTTYFTISFSGLSMPGCIHCPIDTAGDRTVFFDLSGCDPNVTVTAHISACDDGGFPFPWNLDCPSAIGDVAAAAGGIGWADLGLACEDVEGFDAFVGVCLTEFCENTFALVAWAQGVFHPGLSDEAAIKDAPVIFNEVFTWNCPTSGSITVNSTAAGGTSIVCGTSTDTYAGALGICSPWVPTFATQLFLFTPNGMLVEDNPFGGGNAVGSGGSATIVRHT